MKKPILLKLILSLEIYALSKAMILTGKSLSKNIPDGLTITASPSGSDDFDHVTRYLSR